MARRHSEEARRIGGRIAALRERHHLTQEAAATKLRVAYRTYQSWEQGTSVPRWATRERIAKFYSVPVEEINGPPSRDDSQLDRMEAELNRQGELLDALVAAREIELEERAAAAAKRAKQQELDTPHAADRPGRA